MENNCLEPGGVAGRKERGTCQEQPLWGWKGHPSTLDTTSPTGSYIPSQFLSWWGAVPKGTPRLRKSLRGGELRTHPPPSPQELDQTGPGFLCIRAVESSTDIAITAGALHETPR